ncbi:MAG TPA: STAS domain-containing protein [Solirubrobacterales bacterium]
MSEPAATGLSASAERATTPAGAAAAIVAFEGDLDLATVERFEEALDERGATNLIVDLGGVRFIDSSGIHALVRARAARTASDLGTELVVAPGSAVERVLEMSGLLEELGARADRDSALAALDDRDPPANGRR